LNSASSATKSRARDGMSLKVYVTADYASQLYVMLIGIVLVPMVVCLVAYPAPPVRPSP
jgi:hypothetical protein